MMSIDLVPQLAGAAFRVLALGVATFLGLSLFRVRSSATRHAVWTVMLVGMVLQIPLELLAPAIPLKALPTAPGSIQLMIQPRPMEAAAILGPDSRYPGRASDSRPVPARGPLQLHRTFTVVYLVISFLFFARMGRAYRGLRRVLSDVRPIPDLGSAVCESPSLVAPGSVGYFRPRIILPQAWRDWDAAKLRAVLAHERAHIRRADWLIRFASQVNICIFWFHPMAWWTDRELARLAEEACDDAALSEMADRDEYAAALVDIALAAATGNGVLNWWVTPMARHSNVAGRVNRILDWRLPTQKPFGRLAWVTLFACCLPVIYLSAALRLSPTNRTLVSLEHTGSSVLDAEGTGESFLPKKQASVTQVAQMAQTQTPRPAPPPAATRSSVSRSMTMCIVIDNSGSMRKKREAAKAAALALVEATHPPETSMSLRIFDRGQGENQVCIVNFNDEVYFDLPHGEDFTSDINEMEAAIARIDSRGGGAMREAIRMSIDHVQRTDHDGLKILVLITDGDDNSSTATQEQLLSKIRNSDVRIYTIGLVGDDEPRQATAAKLALRQLAEASGGIDYYPRDLAEVESISREIVGELRK
jgi:VWFA-related protein